MLFLHIIVTQHTKNNRILLLLLYVCTRYLYFCNRCSDHFLRFTAKKKASQSKSSVIRMLGSSKQQIVWAIVRMWGAVPSSYNAAVSNLYLLCYFWHMSTRLHLFSCTFLTQHDKIILVDRNDSI